VLLSAGNASALSPVILESITSELVDIERAFTILKRQPPPRATHATHVTHAPADDVDFVRQDGRGGQREDGLADGVISLGEGLAARESRVLSAMRLLCKASLETTSAHLVLARCVRIFKYETALFKWLHVHSGPNRRPPNASARSHREVVTSLPYMAGPPLWRRELSEEAPRASRVVTARTHRASSSYAVRRASARRCLG